MTDMTEAEILRAAAEDLDDDPEFIDYGDAIGRMREKADRLEAAQKVGDRIEIAAKLAHKAYYQHAAHWDSEQYQIDWRNVACALEAHFIDPLMAELDKALTRIAELESVERAPCTHDLDAMVERLLHWPRNRTILTPLFARELIEHVLAVPAKQWTDEDYERIGELVYDYVIGPSTFIQDGKYIVGLVTGVTE